ncbi:MAG: Ku protein [Bdellovibrionaceae bacterium]|nr:Ku protein [Bdellovibrionales bacterium]MCB9253721.1 Ku protein [Pseudobdellovibrionaceae bacterium]
MAIRSIASARLSFGLVTVPVNIYPTGQAGEKISFNWLHKECGHRLKQQYYCPQHNKSLGKADKVKGYEFEKGQYVVFTPDELKVLDAKANQTIEIMEFVPEDSVGRLYLNKIYFLGPDDGGDKPYRLLSAALTKTRKVAIARYKARGKQYLVAIRPEGQGLVMEDLYYAHERKSFKEVPIGKASVTPKELDLAIQVIKSAEAKSFQPGKYKDEVRERVLKQIRKKINGQDITRLEETPEKKVVDLMEALKASLGGNAGTTRLRRASRNRVKRKAK